jgi:hypothetical protein
MMDFGIFYEIQVNSPLKHREREYQAFHDVMERSFMSYVNTTLRVNAAVIEAKKTGVDPKEASGGAVPDLPKQYEGFDPSKVTIDTLIEHGMCICEVPIPVSSSSNEFRRKPSSITFSR